MAEAHFIQSRNLHKIRARIGVSGVAYIGTPGTYEMFMLYWPQQVDNATGVTYRVFNDGGVNDVTVNQAGEWGTRWVKLGTYPI